MANQVSCYEIGAKPGTAFDYNDWQMVGLKAFFDSFFEKKNGEA